MSIADFMFPRPVQNIFRCVFASPGNAFTLKELIAAAAAGNGNGQRHVQRLLDCGVLVEDARRGHQRFIRANEKFPLYPELLSICRKSFGLVEPLRDALESFAAEIVEAFVSGSVAHGTDTHRSDIDLMIIGSASILEVLEVLMPLEKQLGRPIHLNLYALEEWDALKANDSVMSRISSERTLQILP